MLGIFHLILLTPLNVFIYLGGKRNENITPPQQSKHCSKQHQNRYDDQFQTEERIDIVIVHEW